MTKDADLKRVIRDRMTTTGESYTQARAAVLASPPTSAAPATHAPAGPATEPAVERAVPADPFYDKTIRSFFDGDRLRSIPVRRKPRAAVLLHLALRFDPARTYTEREVSDLLEAAHEDYAWLRRELVEIGYLERSAGIYRRTTSAPERSATLRQEVPVSEAARLGWA